MISGFKLENLFEVKFDGMDEMTIHDNRKQYQFIQDGCV
jgi:hypothetical protein